MRELLLVLALADYSGPCNYSSVPIGYHWSRTVVAPRCMSILSGMPWRIPGETCQQAARTINDLPPSTGNGCKVFIATCIDEARHGK